MVNGNNPPIIRKCFKPFVHSPPRNGERDKRTDPDEHCEVPAEETNDTTYAGAKDFANTDLFGTLFRSIGNKTEETEAGNQDGEDGEGDEDLAGLLLGVIQIIKY